MKYKLNDVVTEDLSKWGGVRGKFVWWLNIIPMQSAYIVYIIKFIRPVFYMWSGFLHVIRISTGNRFLHVIRFSPCDPVFYMWSGFLHVIRFSTCDPFSPCDPIFTKIMLHVIRFSTCDSIFTKKLCWQLWYS